MDIIPYNAKIIQGCGWVEGVEFHGKKNPLASVSLVATKRGGGAPRTRSVESLCEGVPPCRQEENLERALRRAKTMIRRKIKELYGKSGGKLYMLTLTYRENMNDYDRAVRDIRAFFLRLRRRVGRSVGYIGVPEKQERGAWHWHIVTDVHIDYRVWEKLWGHGFIWIKRVKGLRQVTRYVCKYITKVFEGEEGMGVPKGRHRYLTSKGLGSWKVEYRVVKDKLGTWFWFSDRERDWEVVSVFSNDEEGVAWWEAISSLDITDEFVT